MLVDDFIAAKRGGWERLTALLDKSRLGGLAAAAGLDRAAEVPVPGRARRL